MDWRQRVMPRADRDFCVIFNRGLRMLAAHTHRPHLTARRALSRSGRDERHETRSRGAPDHRNAHGSDPNTAQPGGAAPRHKRIIFAQCELVSRGGVGSRMADYS